MDKELENLLDNYENAIYGQAFPITPSIHQLHLLLDYIANLEQQCKKQKEVIDKAIEYINNLECLHIGIGENEYNLDKMYGSTKNYVRDLLEILKEVAE